jgi:hypothetical protein
MCKLFMSLIKIGEESFKSPRQDLQKILCVFHVHFAKCLWKLNVFVIKVLGKTMAHVL